MHSKYMSKNTKKLLIETRWRLRPMYLGRAFDSHTTWVALFLFDF
jgi:hypothetical protein